MDAGDVVFTIDGVLLGIAAVHFSEELPCCISNHMVRMRSGVQIIPEYLALYLNSPLGQQQIKRGITGSAIPGLRTDAIKRMFIALPPIDTQRALVAEMKAAQETRRRKLAEADALLAGFDEYLLDRLGLAAVTGQDQAAFATRLDQVRSSKRINPQYFHPERMSAIQAMQNASTNLKPYVLSTIADFKREVVPADASDNYIGLANVQSNTGELVKTTDRPSGTCFRFSEDDVLFARLRPYLNKVHRAERSGVCSMEFHVIRLHKEEGSENEVLPGYLSSILRSSMILAQVKYMTTGNTHPRLANEDVVNLVIPVPEVPVQREIVAEMHRRRKESRKLKGEARVGWEEAKAEFERKLLGRESG